MMLWAMFAAAAAEGDPEPTVFNLTVRKEQMAPDCHEGNIYTVNGEFPGPTIWVDPGEHYELHVTNELKSEAFSIHHHGNDVKGKPWMDGTFMVTGCGVAPGETFKYEYVADNDPGMSYYHSHVQGHTLRGMQGAVITRAPEGYYGQVIEGEYVMMIHDWFHDTENFVEMLRSNPFQWIRNPKSVLINGKGIYEPDREGCDVNTEYFQVKPDSYYLFHIVNAGWLTFLNLKIEDHEMTVVGVDN